MSCFASILIRMKYSVALTALTALTLHQKLGYWDANMIDAAQFDILHYFLSLLSPQQRINYLQLSAPALQGISSVRESERERAHTWAGPGGGQLSLTRTVGLHSHSLQPRTQTTETLSDN